MQKQIRKKVSLTLLLVLIGPLLVQAGTQPLQVWADQGKPGRSPAALSQASPTNTNEADQQKFSQDHQHQLDEANQKFQKAAHAQLQAKGLPDPHSAKVLKQSTVTMLVEFDRDPAALKLTNPGQKPVAPAVNQASQAVIDQHKTAQQKIEKIAGHHAQKSFGYLVNGISIDAKVGDADKIKAIPGVKEVQPTNVYQPSHAYQPQDLAADQIIGALPIWAKHRIKGDKTIIAIIDSGIDDRHELMKLSPKAQVKMTKDQAKVAIKRLGHGRYASEKIPYAYNYADGTSQTVADLKTNSMHGMHVAGIAAGYAHLPDRPKFDQRVHSIGAAPHAQLLNMKIFSNNGGGPAAMILLPLLKTQSSWGPMS